MVMETKHHWTVTPRSDVVDPWFIRDGNDPVAKAYSTDAARLIIAAPDLYYVAKRLSEYAASQPFNYPLGSLQQINDAIAKAEGR